MTQTQTAAYEQIERDLVTVDRLILGSRVAGIISAIMCAIVLAVGLMMIGDLWPPKATRAPDSPSSSPSS